MFLRIAGLLFSRPACLFHAVEKKLEVKHTPASVTSARAGKKVPDLLRSCQCGQKGEGPPATALKSKPANLTELAKNNGGKFSSDRVYSILRRPGDEDRHSQTSADRK